MTVDERKNKIGKSLDRYYRLKKERTEYTCLACISIDSVLKVDKKIIHRFI